MTGRYGRLFDGCIVHLSTAYNCKCATKAYSYNFKVTRCVSKTCWWNKNWVC